MLPAWLADTDWALAVPGLVTGTLYLVLAAILLRAEQSRVVVAFVLFLIARGAINLGSYWISTAEYWNPVLAVGTVAGPVVTAAGVWFLLCYRRAYAGTRPHTWAIVPLVAWVAVVGTFSLWQPNAFIDFEADRPGWIYELDTARFWVYWLVGLVVGRMAFQTDDPSLRRSHVAVASGFLLFPCLVVGASAFPILAGGQLPASLLGPLGLPGYWLFMIPNLAGVATIAWFAVRGRGSVPGFGILAVAGAIAFVAGLVIGVQRIDQAAPDWTLAYNLWLDAIVTSAQPILVFIALARRRIFDLDLRLRFTIRQSTLAATFVAIYFAVSEGAAAIFTNRWGPGLGIAAAALLVFGIAPLHRAAESLAARATPQARPVEAMDDADRQGVYRDQAALLWADGALSSKERRALDQLRTRLDIAAADAMRIESSVLR